MRHSRRNKLTCDDIKRALEIKGMEPVYGYMNTPYSRAGHPKLKKTVQAGGVLVYQVEDEEIEIESIASTLSSRYNPPPRKGGVGWKAHWLAVEGVQPLIPENPPPSELIAAHSGGPDDNDFYESAAAVAFSIAGGSSSTSGAVAAAPMSTSAASTNAAVREAAAANANTKDVLTVNAQAQPLVKHILSRELQVYYQRLTEAIMHGAAPATAATASTSGADATDAQGDLSMDSTAEDAGRSSIAGDAISLAALSSLRSDPGLHQLVPYLCQWISTTITAALALPTSVTSSNTMRKVIIDRMLGSIEAMLLNPNLGIEGYIHLLLPPLLSCILISLPSTVYDAALRKRGAELLGTNVLARFGGAYPSLKPRIARVLLEAVFNGVDTVDANSAKAEGDGENRRSERAAVADGDEDDDDDDQPRPTLGTKLGAILALRACGGGMTRALVRAKRQESHRPSSKGNGSSSAAGGPDSSSYRNEFGCKFCQLGAWIQSRSTRLPSSTGPAAAVATRRSRRTAGASTPGSQRLTGTEDSTPGQIEFDLDSSLVISAVRDCLRDLAATDPDGMGRSSGGSVDGVDHGDYQENSLRSRVGAFWAEQFEGDAEAKKGISVGLADLPAP